MVLISFLFFHVSSFSFEGVLIVLPQTSLICLNIIS